MANPVIYFDLPAGDVARARKFYDKVFGWKSESWGGGYYSLDTTGRGGEGIDGGVYKREDKGDVVVNYIKVPSIDKSLMKIKENGGKIVQDKTPIPEWGAYAVFKDSEGNMMGLHEFAEKKKKR